MIVGLTGGIGSGKSTVADYFARLGVPVIDTDVIAHQLTAADMPAVIQIAQTFGHEYLNPDGTLDRAKLRGKIFTDHDARKLLENILHPLIRTAATIALSESSATPYQILVVPLLFETGSYRDLIHRSLVVDCSEEQQMRRTATRGLTENEVHAIMAAQMSRKERLTHADDVMLNEGDLQELAARVRAQHEKYINTCVVRQSTT